MDKIKVTAAIKILSLLILPSKLLQKIYYKLYKLLKFTFIMINIKIEENHIHKLDI